MDMFEKHFSTELFEKHQTYIYITPDSYGINKYNTWSLEANRYVSA